MAGHVDLPAFGRVLDGVVEQVHRQPPHQQLVPMNRHLAIGLIAEREATRRSHAACRAHALHGQFLQVEIARTQRILSRIGASQGEEIVHDL